MVIEGKFLCNGLQQQDMHDRLNEVLLDVTKPSRYIGKEIGSFNKDWDTSLVKVNIAFPDLYEIGISNLGHRILYYLINNQSSNDFMADRSYAPDLDLKQKMVENQIPLYGVESLKPLYDFDVIAFSLQYELSYPTILSMLEMGKIPVKSIDRGSSDPIIIAGGPGSYNPEPMADFIDAFIIGDGEEVIIQIIEEIKKSKLNNYSKEDTLKSLSKIEGIYVPVYYREQNAFSKPLPISTEFPDKINKRISELKNDNFPVNFPVPYSSSVHDRAVIEIRRGCGRMCRFCQSCFVNLPVRERDPESVIKLVRETLKNTGYEEYSLLSLSSSDYDNIENLVGALNCEHSKSGTSLSLPSQRADAFSLELANLVQSVRKSTLTFAPEAGSQRLRDAINKNLSEDQILNAVLSAYKAGWSSVKLYFMVGLPTETFEDLDEIINLLKLIKDKAREIKSSFDIKKHLDITCTVSIFVPKPFTPFQWYGQDNIELIEEKIKYLRQQVKFLKGVKLNFHDSFLSQLEAVFARGDRTLGNLIMQVYKKGSYLDAWNEHFNKKIWYEAANEIGSNFNSYASRNIDLESELPWDFINIGVDKEWLKQEYLKSRESLASIPCDINCSSCGVCDSYKTKPAIKSGNPVKIQNQECVNQVENSSAFRYRLKFQKTGNLKYISHLDWQKMIYMAFRKAEINLCFTMGFNPSPKISIGLALPLFVESFEEYVDIEIKEQMQENILLERLNSYLPENSKVLEIVKISKDEPAIDRTINWAKYSAYAIDSSALKKIDLKYIVNNVLSKDNIIIEKQKHKGSKKLIDIRPSIFSIEIKEYDNSYKLEFILKAGQGNGCTINSESPVNLQNQNGTLRADVFLKFLTPDIKWNIVREKMFDCNFKELI